MVDLKSMLEAVSQRQHQSSSNVTTSLSNDAETESTVGFLERISASIWWRHLLAGGVAGALSRTATAPMDRMKIYTQVHSHSMSLYQLMQFLVREGGVVSLWRGNSINVMKVMPESALKFSIYEKIKRLMHGKDRREFSSQERFFAGACTGGITQSAVYPLDVFKVRLALRMSGNNDGISHIARHMYLHEGLRSFYRGYAPSLMGSIPYGGIEFAIYEGLKRKYKTCLSKGEEPGFLMLCVFSSFSSMVGQCCVYPFALVRTRLQSGLIGQERTFRILYNIIKNEGPRGLYRGLIPNIYKVVPAVSINFVAYEYVSRRLGIYMS